MGLGMVKKRSDLYCALNIYQEGSTPQGFDFEAAPIECCGKAGYLHGF